jgi:hypothetical protein
VDLKLGVAVGDPADKPAQRVRNAVLFVSGLKRDPGVESQPISRTLCAALTIADLTALK